MSKKWRAARAMAITRQELYDDTEKSARLDSTFLVLVFLSTIVAAIGLIEDNVAVVIGAMVIAPLLGPNIALALGTALGDTALMWRSLKTNLAGLCMTLVLSILIALFWPLNIDSHELLARTDVGLDSVALAFASGAAAALSLTTGLSSVLVGVMVAGRLAPACGHAWAHAGQRPIRPGNGCGLAVGRQRGVRESFGQAGISGEGHTSTHVVGEKEGAPFHDHVYRDLGRFAAAGGFDLPAPLGVGRSVRMIEGS